MRTFATVLATAMLSTAILAGATLPRKAPEFVIQSPNGKQTLLSSYRGKVVVMAFMFTTCSHCQHTAGVLAAVQKEYESKGVQVLGGTFDKDAPQQVEQFNKMFGVTYPCGFTTPKNVLQFLQIPENDPYFVPILVFIDKAGNIRSQYIGDEKFLDKQEVNIRAEIDKLLKGGPATPAPPASAAKKSAPKQ